MILLDGKKVREFYRSHLADKVGFLPFKPRLALFQIGENERSSIYIEQKIAFARSIDVDVDHIKMPEDISFDQLASAIKIQNEKSDVHGIIIQLPLPDHLNKDRVIDLIDPKKDVDGLTSQSQEMLAKGTPFLVPATAKAVCRILDFYNIDVKGKKVAVMGRSKLVGSPTARMLELKGADVSVCHSETDDPKSVTRSADILVVAIGKPKLVGAEYVKPDSIIIDVGINTVESDGAESLENELPRRKLVGDVDYSAVLPLIKAITPVPGGVGPVTVLCLFDNLIEAAERTVTI